MLEIRHVIVLAVIAHAGEAQDIRCSAWIDGTAIECVAGALDIDNAELNALICQRFVRKNQKASIFKIDFPQLPLATTCFGVCMVYDNSARTVSRDHCAVCCVHDPLLCCIGRLIDWD